MSNAGVSRVGPPDFKSFRKKRKLSIGDVIIWSESGKETYQGKSRKKRYRKKKHRHKPKRGRPSANKARVRQKNTQLRAQKLIRKRAMVQLAKLRKKATRLVQKRAQRLERLLHEIKHGKPKKRTKRTTSKKIQPKTEVAVMSKMALIQSILWKRRGQRG